MKKLTLMRFVCLSLLALMLTACASEEEKQERRENAFDISGDYLISKKTGSEIDMDFEIRNETGRHDIIVYLNRKSDFLPKEIDFLKAQNIKASALNAFKGPIVLGRGYKKGKYDELDGGENISTDFGETSKFYVCSDEQHYNAEYKISYCLSGTISKKKRELNGQLSLNWSRMQKSVNENGETVTTFSFAKTELNYKANLNSVFYKQYIGSWSGQVHPLVDGFESNLLSSLTISERKAPRGDQSKGIYSVAFNATEIKYNGNKYVFSSKDNQLDLLKLMEPYYPAIQSIYVYSYGDGVSNVPSDRIVFIGQIWSLGDLTGTIVHIKGNKQKDLATVSFKKD